MFFCVIVDAALCSECGYITCCARGVVQMRNWGVESDWARVISVTSGDCALLFSSDFIQLYNIQRKLFVKYSHLVDEDRYDGGGAGMRADRCAGTLLSSDICVSNIRVKGNESNQIKSHFHLCPIPDV